jgi:hypothetical protein
VWNSDLEGSPGKGTETKEEREARLEKERKRAAMRYNTMSIEERKKKVRYNQLMKENFSQLSNEHQYERLNLTLYDRARIHRGFFTCRNDGYRDSIRCDAEGSIYGSTTMKHGYKYITSMEYWKRIKLDIVECAIAFEKDILPCYKQFLVDDRTNPLSKTWVYTAIELERSHIDHNRNSSYSRALLSKHRHRNNKWFYNQRHI